jgi:hypothetical protein
LPRARLSARKIDSGKDQMTRLLALLLTLACLSATASAQDAKAQKITELVKVTRLDDMFEQQISQGRASYAAFGRKLFTQMIEESGTTDPSKRERLEAIFARYLENGASTWKSEDLVAIWTRHFGQGLDEDDLDRILIFYRSPSGQRLVAANQEAMTAFISEAAALSQDRLRTAVERLRADLKEELAR